MKNACIALTLLFSFTAFGQTIEDRINKTYPNDSVEFDSPQYLGYSFLDDKGYGTTEDVGRKICKFLKYSDLLAVTSEEKILDLDVKGWSLKNNQLVLKYNGYLRMSRNGFVALGYNSSMITSLRCLK